MNEDRLLRVPEVAERTGLRESSIRKMIFLKKLPTVRIGRAVSIPKSAIDKLIKDGYCPVQNELDE